MTTEATMTHWLLRLKDGDREAVGQLWKRCFQNLLRLADRHLQGRHQAAADDEDVALSAFHSFCRGVAAERFEQLEDRNDLWQILAMMIRRKALRLLRHETALKRGGGRVYHESALSLLSQAGTDVGFGSLVGSGPDPELTAIMNETITGLLQILPDDDLRQVAVMRLEGHSNQEVATALNRHIRSVERKLQLIRRFWEDAVPRPD